MPKMPVPFVQASREGPRVLDVRVSENKTGKEYRLNSREITAGDSGDKAGRSIRRLCEKEKRQILGHFKSGRLGRFGQEENLEVEATKGKGP